MNKILLASAIALFSANPVLAAAPKQLATGNDISYPQCKTKLPTGQLFGIVGVNDGLANNTNPCLAKEQAWAAASTGTTLLGKEALYINTANPALASTTWPTNNTSFTGSTIATGHGTCDHTDSAVCAYVYGYKKSQEDVLSRGVSTPTAFQWWLDVETANSWETGSSVGQYNDVAALEGFVQGLLDSGVTKVGLYSTSYQWVQIVGTQVGSTSNLNGLDSWLPGATSLAGAQSNCSQQALTTSGKVTISQYFTSTIDRDISCF